MRAVADITMAGKSPRRRPRLRWKGTVRRDMKAVKIREEWAVDTPKNGKVSARPAITDMAVKSDKKGERVNTCDEQHREM